MMTHPFQNNDFHVNEQSASPHLDLHQAQAEINPSHAVKSADPTIFSDIKN